MKSQISALVGQLDRLICLSSSVPLTNPQTGGNDYPDGEEEFKHVHDSARPAPKLCF